MLTLEQLGKDGEILERRRVLVSYHEGDRSYADMLIMERYDARNP